MYKGVLRTSIVGSSHPNNRYQYTYEDLLGELVNGTITGSLQSNKNKNNTAKKKLIRKYLKTEIDRINAIDDF